MRNRQVNDRLCLQLFKISYALFLTYSLIAHIPLFKSVLKAGTIIAIILFIVNFLIQYNHTEVKTFVIYVVLMAFSLLQAHYSNDYGLFKLILFAGSIRKLRFKDVIRFDMKLRIVLILIVILLCLIGVAPDVTVLYHGILRRSMGFTNPNTLGVAVFILVCDFVYVWDMKLNWRRCLLLTGLVVWLYFVARSRTAVSGIVVVVVLALLYSRWPVIFRCKAGKGVLIGSMAFFALLTLLLSLAYKNGAVWAIELDENISGRIGRIIQFSELLKVKVFGQPISEELNKSLDNAYAFVWYDLGLVTFALFLFAFIRAQIIHSKTDTPMTILLAAFALYGLSEHLWINVDYNVFMLVFCCAPQVAGQQDPKMLDNQWKYG